MNFCKSIFSLYFLNNLLFFLKIFSIILKECINKRSTILPTQGHHGAKKQDVCENHGCCWEPKLPFTEGQSELNSLKKFLTYILDNQTHTLLLHSSYFLHNLFNFLKNLLLFLWISVKVYFLYTSLIICYFFLIFSL